MNNLAISRAILKGDRQRSDAEQIGLQNHSMGGNDDSRTDTVELMHKLPHHAPDDGEDLWERTYIRGLVFVGAGILLFGILLLLSHATYRCCICLRCCCFKRKGQSCVDKQRGQRRRWQASVALMLLLIIGSLGLGGLRARGEFVDAVNGVSDALDELIDTLEQLQDIVVNMADSARLATSAASSVSCSGQVADVDSFLNEVATLNETIEVLDGAFDDALDPLDNVQDKLDSKGRKYVRNAVPLLVGAPFVLSIGLSCCGLLSSNCFPKLACCQLNVMSCWSGGVGLPISLIIFTYAFVSNLFFADFCYISPSEALNAKSDDNRYVAYYLECTGENPFADDVNNATSAVNILGAYADNLHAASCTPTSALDTIDREVARLENDILNVSLIVLSCESFEDVVDALFNRAICDKTVNGLFAAWITIGMGGILLLVLLFCIPLANNGFTPISEIDDAPMEYNFEHSFPSKKRGSTKVMPSSSSSSAPYMSPLP